MEFVNKSERILLVGGEASGRHVETELFPVLRVAKAPKPPKMRFQETYSYEMFDCCYEEFQLRRIRLDTGTVVRVYVSTLVKADNLTVAMEDAFGKVCEDASNLR
jgi:hypothetical protein